MSFSFGAQATAQTALQSVHGATKSNYINSMTRSAGTISPLDAWAGTGRLLDLKRSYAPVVDSNGAPLADCAPGSFNNRYCEFETITYSSTVNSRSSLRPTHISQRRWQQAERDNPDAEHLEPVAEIGVSALKKRYDSQQAEKVRLRAYTDELAQAIALLNHTTSNAILKYEDLSSKQSHLFNKLLRLLMKIELVRCHGTSVANSEHR